MPLPRSAASQPSDSNPPSPRQGPASAESTRRPRRRAGLAMTPSGRVASADPVKGDDIDPRRFNHDAIIAERRDVTADDGSVIGQTTGMRVISQTPLDRYLIRDNITQTQWLGGDRLRADFERSSFENTAQSRYDTMPSGGGWDPGAVTVAICAARRSYLTAIQALPVRLSPVIVHVCCLRGYAADWARAKHLPKNDGMALLRLGLDILADHYGKPPKRT